MIPSFGITEIAIILVIVLLLFGAKRIPGLARSLGTGLREFRQGVLDKDESGTPGKKLPLDENAHFGREA